MTEEEIGAIVNRLRPYIEDSQTQRYREEDEVKTLLEKMLEQQATEAQHKAQRWQFAMRYVVGPVVAFLVGGGAVGGYTLANQPKRPSPDELTTEAAESAASKTSLPIKLRVGDLESKVQRLGIAVVEQQVQLSEGIQYIADKIDAAHPSKADKIPVPETVKAASDKAAEIERLKQVDALLDGNRSGGDPFSRLPAPKSSAN